MKKNLLCAAIAALAPLCAAPTQAALQDANVPVNNLSAGSSVSTLIVTASRTQQTSTEVLASASVIEREDIDRLQPDDVTALLNKIPGAIVTRSGGPGSQSSLFLRGTNNEHTLVLLDGQRIASATLGSTSFQFLDPEQIERIEVVRGPRSSLYGSDAIGGVVQIFTRSIDSLPTAYVSAGYGSHDSYRSSAGGGGQFGNLRISGGASHFFTDGFSNLEDHRGSNGDNDAYRNNSFNGKIGYDFEGGAKLDLIHFYTQVENEYDSVYSPMVNPYSDSWIQNTSLVFQATPLPFWKTTASIGHSVDDSDDFNSSGSGSHSHFRTARNSASWQNDFALDKTQVVTAGVDYYKENINSSTVYTDSNGNEIDDRDVTGYFAQYLLSQSIFDLQIGARSDHIERVGTETTGNLAIGFNLPAQHRLIFSAGKAFRAPTVNDLYWPINIYEYGNPNLKPEKSKNYEVELRGDYKPLRWALSAYQNKVENLIQWAQDPASPNFAYTPSNVANVKIRGADFTVSTDIQQWFISGRFSYVDPRDEDTDLVLQERNRRTFGLDADRQFGKWGVGANWLLQDSRYADAANTHKLGGFGAVDLHASYEPTPSWKIALRLNNIFDKEYATQSTSWQDAVTFDRNWADFNTDRFGWFASVTYRMQ